MLLEVPSGEEDGRVGVDAYLHRTPSVRMAAPRDKLKESNARLPRRVVSRPAFCCLGILAYYHDTLTH